jgi:hypothetical protein
MRIQKTKIMRIHADADADADPQRSKRINQPSIRHALAEIFTQHANREI